MFGLQIRQDIDSFQREMEQLFTGLGWSPEAVPGAREPGFQVKDQGDSYLAQAALPGLDLSQLDISVLGRKLSISGAFSENEKAEEVRWYRRERQQGKFEKTLQLTADIDSERVEAEYDKGILKLKLPKSAAALPKKISVKAN
jgi:HSP20 family protein